MTHSGYSHSASSRHVPVSQWEAPSSTICCFPLPQAARALPVCRLQTKDWDDDPHNQSPQRVPYPTSHPLNSESVCIDTREGSAIVGMLARQTQFWPTSSVGFILCRWKPNAAESTLHIWKEMPRRSVLFQNWKHLFHRQTMPTARVSSVSGCEFEMVTTATLFKIKWNNNPPVSMIKDPNIYLSIVY